jgi:hypothetical protein
METYIKYKLDYIETRSDTSSAINYITNSEEEVTVGTCRLRY